MNFLALQTHAGTDTVRLAVGGELDLSSALVFEQELRRAEQPDPAVIVLDLSALKFMDSTGLRLVLSADGRARRRGRRLVIIEGSEAVRRLFRLAGVSDRLELLDGERQPHPSAR